MSDTSYNELMLLLRDFLLVLGFALFALSFVVGVLMVIKPSIVNRLNKSGGSSFSFRRSSRLLEIPNFVDHVFYHHHKIIGPIIVITALYVMYYFTQVYDANVVSRLMEGSKHAIAAEIVAAGTQIFLLLTSAVILVIGIIMFFRPSLLKGFEAWANQWISTRQAAKPLSTSRDQVNQLAYKYPRLVGITIILLSLYATFGLIMIYI